MGLPAATARLQAGPVHSSVDAAEDAVDAADADVKQVRSTCVRACASGRRASRPWWSPFSARLPPATPFTRRGSSAVTGTCRSAT